jgi:Holliday junction DNA helicase RuvA
MIHYLKGKIAQKGDKFLVMEVAGVGYKVFCSLTVLRRVVENTEAKLFTYLHLKEDAVELYGFLGLEELELFETLNDISGIGPKTALLLASLGSLEKLKETIEKDQLPQEIKGIGQKKAQKILLELTGKIKEIAKPEKNTGGDEALDALVSLGIPAPKAKTALSQVSPEIVETEAKIKKALEYLGGNKK